MTHQKNQTYAIECYACENYWDSQSSRIEEAEALAKQSEGEYHHEPL